MYGCLFISIINTEEYNSTAQAPKIISCLRDDKLVVRLTYISRFSLVKCRSYLAIVLIVQCGNFKRSILGITCPDSRKRLKSASVHLKMRF
jgi:hypothetical protein